MSLSMRSSHSRRRATWRRFFTAFHKAATPRAAASTSVSVRTTREVSGWNSVVAMARFLPLSGWFGGLPARFGRGLKAGGLLEHPKYARMGLITPTNVYNIWHLFE